MIILGNLEKSWRNQLDPDRQMAGRHDGERRGPANASGKVTNQGRAHTIDSQSGESTYN